MAGKQQRLAAAVDAAGELAILLDSLEALFQYSCALEAARESIPGEAKLPGPGTPQTQQQKPRDAMPGQQEETAQEAIHERLGGLEARGLGGGVKEAPDARETASNGGANGTAAKWVAEGLRWGMEALRATVVSGAVVTRRNLMRPDVFRPLYRFA